jgi:hypothetical protein
MQTDDLSALEILALHMRAYSKSFIVMRAKRPVRDSTEAKTQPLRVRWHAAMTP